MSCPWWSVFIPPLITAVTILGVGLWVNTTIRKKNHKEALIFNYLQEVARQIQRLTAEAVDAETLNTSTLKIRHLSNEIQHLMDLHSQFAPSSTSPRLILIDHILELKWHLTESGGTVEEAKRVRARQTGNKLRTEVLHAVLTICDKS